jgi:hypothetical protein
MLCPSHYALFDIPNDMWWGVPYRSISPSLCSILHSPLTSTLLGPNILFNTLFSNTIQPPSTWATMFHIRTKQQENYISLFFNLYIFWWQTERQKILHWFSMLLFASPVEFWSSKLFQISKLFHPFKDNIIGLHIVTSSYILVSRHEHVIGLSPFALVQSPH